VQECVERIGPRKEVVEYGSRHINGSIRPLFTGGGYVGVDIVGGSGVDVVADACSYKPRVTPDTIVCCEVLEHTIAWPDIVKAAGRVLSDDGVFILTCATEPRAPHSAYDGGQVRPGEYYGNVDILEFTNVLFQAGFKQHETTKTLAGDLQCIAWKKEQD
jgi:hypothetical protein